MAYKKYLVYLDDGSSVFKVGIPAKSEKAAREYLAGNGEIVAIKDVTEEYPIDLGKVKTALALGGFGEAEIGFITRALDQTEIASWE